MNTTELNEIDAFVRGYLEAVLWIEIDDDEEPLDDTYRLHDFDLWSIIRASSEAVDFLNNAGGLLEYAAQKGEYAARTQRGADRREFFLKAGHDFLLTRNGHGVGFWDRGLGAVGDILTEIAQSYGSVHAYVRDEDTVAIDAA